MAITGIARKDTRTKNLVLRLEPDDIAIIDHDDIDRVSADTLVASHVRAVINVANSITGTYPNVGPSILVGAGIVLLDRVGREFYEQVQEGTTLTIDGCDILTAGKVVASGELLDNEAINKQMQQAEEHLDEVMENFVQNTVSHLEAQMVNLIYEPWVPPIKTSINGRQALVVARGYDYLADLKMLKPYINEVKPVLIAVDGGADALLEQGFTPDIIVGDMDSVTDSGLLCGAEIIPHSYEDGTCNSLERMQGLGLEVQPWPLATTSEDLALLLAWQKKADLIVALGTHSNLIEYLDKGRSGMASSFLIRLKVGTKLVDAKGVSKLYRAAPPAWHIAIIAVAALAVLVTAITISDPLRNFLSLIWLNIRTSLGF